MYHVYSSGGNNLTNNNTFTRYERSNHFTFFYFCVVTFLTMSIGYAQGIDGK